MHRNDTWLGIVEKVAAKSILAKIELDVKLEGKRRTETTKKIVKTGKTRKEDSKKFSTSTSTKGTLSCEVNSKTVLRHISPEPGKGQVKVSTSTKLPEQHQKNNEIVGKLAFKPLSSTGIRKNAQGKALHSELGRIKRTAPKEKPVHEDSKNASENVHGKSIYNLTNSKSVSENQTQNALKDTSAFTSEAIQKRNNNVTTNSLTESRKWEDPKSCKPVSIIPPCPNISEFGNKMNVSMLKRSTTRRMVVKAKSAIELTTRATDHSVTPVAPEDEIKPEMKSKPPAKVTLKDLPKDGGQIEIAKKWKGGTHISTTALGVRKPTVRPQRPSVPRNRPRPQAMPSFELSKKKLCSSSSLIQLMLVVEDALQSCKNNPYEKCRSEQLMNKFKEELNKVLIYPENIPLDRNSKLSTSRPKHPSHNKKIRISECSDVKVYTEMLEGTREYNWKTKSAVQHRPADSPWLSVLLPKEEGDSAQVEKPPKKVIVIPEVDPMNEIVEACVEKELRRCDGFANVKKAKCKDVTKEKVLLYYEQSAIEKYSPFIDSEQISDLFVKYGLSFILNTKNRLGITLSATEVNQLSRRKALQYIPTPVTPCTPMSEKYVKATKTLKKNSCKKRRKDKKQYLKKGHKVSLKKGHKVSLKKGYKVSHKKNVLLEELQKQIDSTPPYIFDRDKSLTELNFEQEPKTYINLSESQNTEFYDSEDECSEVYVADYVVDKSKSIAFRLTADTNKHVNVKQVIDTLEKAQNLLLNIPSDILDSDKNSSDIHGEEKKKLIPNEINSHTEVASSPGPERIATEDSLPKKLTESDNSQDGQTPDIWTSDLPLVKNLDDVQSQEPLDEFCKALLKDKLDSNIPYETNNQDLELEQYERQPHISKVEHLSNDENKNEDKQLSKQAAKGKVQTHNPDLQESPVANQELVANKDKNFEEPTEICLTEFKKNQGSEENQGVCLRPNGHEKYNNDNCENANNLKGKMEKNTSTRDKYNETALHFSWRKMYYTSPITGKTVGYTRKENFVMLCPSFMFQLPNMFHVAITEAMSTYEKSISYFDSSYKNEAFNVLNQDKLLLIKNIVQSASINTIGGSKRKSYNNGQFNFSIFFVQTFQPFSNICQQTVMDHNKMFFENTSKHFQIERYLNRETTNIPKSVLEDDNILENQYPRYRMARTKSLASLISRINDIASDFNDLTYKIKKHFRRISKKMVVDIDDRKIRGPSKNKHSKRKNAFIIGYNERKNNCCIEKIPAFDKIVLYLTWFILVIQMYSAVCIN